MLFSIDQTDGELEALPEQKFTELELREQDHLEEWVIETPEILGEDLFVIASQYGKFEDLRDRLDVLALDRDGKLVIVELKRDKADRTTDLQAVKYASYCATLTAEDIQKDYQQYWNGRDGGTRSPEDVGEEFAQFLSEDALGDVAYIDEGWANFELDDTPRILLAAGSFGPEITSPAIWLREEFSVDIACTRIKVYEHRGSIVFDSQQVLPIPEAEEYLAKRRQKERKQGHQSRTYTLPTLLDRGVLDEDDIVQFQKSKIPDQASRKWDPESEYWQARVTGKTGEQNNIEWLQDENEYSFTGLTKEILNRLVGRPKDDPLNGFAYWAHEAYDDRSLVELRQEDVTSADRESEAILHPAD